MRRVLVTTSLVMALVGTLVAPAEALVDDRAVHTQGASCALVGRPTWTGRTTFRVANFTRYYARITCYVRLKWQNGWVRTAWAYTQVPAFTTTMFWYRFRGNWEWVTLTRVTIQRLV